MSNRTPWGFSLLDWKRAYGSGAFDLRDLAGWVAAFDRSDPAWIRVAEPPEVLSQIDRLPELREHAQVDRLPLDGIPFAIKDNIDARGWPTTAACPSFSRVAELDAEIVRRLTQAGAILVGKTNLDQFATGLSGTRSPYGVVPSSLDPARIGGGSSSGSAAVVAKGLVPFSLGTDTAGSGRVPAAFHNIVGYKPTRGRFSTRGLVPACRTLDCPSIFALTVADAAEVAALLDAYDPLDPYSRRAPSPPASLLAPRVGWPRELEFFGDDLAARAFERACATVRTLGLRTTTVDFTPFSQLAGLLYSASWVAERSLVAGELLDVEGAMEPTVRSILLQGRERTAEQAFAAEYRRAELARLVDEAFRDMDVLLVPTTPTVYRISEMLEAPLSNNTRLGTYTNFTNLADLCALALPGPFRDDDFPAGMTLIARAHHERWLVDLATVLEQAFDLPRGATGRHSSAVTERAGEAQAGSAPTYFPAPAECMAIAVVGAHLSGMALSSQLTSRGAVLLEARRTAPAYELRLLAGPGPERPGLFRTFEAGSTGAAIEVEVWALPSRQVGSFLELIPAPLGLGSLELDDGTWVRGFICEPRGRAGSIDITRFGGFREFLRRRSTGSTDGPGDPA